MTREEGKIPHIFIARAFFVLAFVVVAWLFWSIIAPYAITLATAGVAAVLASPLEARLRRAVRFPRLSALLTVLIVLICVVGPLVLVGIVMVNQAVQLVRDLVGEGGWISTFSLIDAPWFTILPDSVQTQLASFDIRAALLEIANWTKDHLGVIFASSADFIFKTFIFFVCLYFFIVDRERIMTELLALSPFQDATDRAILERMTATVRAVVSGSLIVAVVQGVLAAIGMTIAGVPGALLWAGLVVVAANVPFIGTGAILVPAIAYLFFTGNISGGTGLLIWAIVIVGTVDNLLKPYLVEGRTKMHSLLILLAILGGLQLFGPIGLIIGPTVLAAFLALLELYQAGVLEKRKI